LHETSEDDFALMPDKESVFKRRLEKVYHFLLKLQIIFPSMKDYQKWHILKNELDKKEHTIFVNEREICYTSIGENIGFEQNGKNELFERPVLVLRKF
jgi:hypothetical protein